MKAFAIFTILACFVACTLAACDPDDNNQPNCSADNLNVEIRNFWDPTAYWVCNERSGNATLVRCPTAHLFDSNKGECVMWNEWEWTNPCPETN
ncbi:uncharacterized protein LOC142228376 [Haematobia irritans]|uniref:uncharacterized protein LOC142228376 n=1 Tax=Haematobia irritans TaxID=7368 RepID=UPI003F4F656C